MTDLHLSVRLKAEFDQAKAEIAAIRERMRELGLEAARTGAASATGGAQIAGVAPQAAAAGEAVARAGDSAALSREEIAALAGSWTGLLVSLDPAIGAALRFEEAQAMVTRAVAAGVVGADQGAAALDRLAIKLGLAEDLAARQAQETAQLTQGFAALRASLDPAVAAEQRFAEAQGMVNRAVAAGVVSAREGQAALGQLATKLGLAEAATEAAAAAQVRLQASSGAAAGQMGNLAAQWNDVVMMALAGQNPFQLAIQQGTQITQVFGGTGAGGALHMLGASALSLLSPFNLLVIGGIAAGTALVQWFMAAGEEVRSVEDAVRGLEDAIQEYTSRSGKSLEELRKDFGEVTPEAIRLNREMADLAGARAIIAATEALRALKAETEGGWLSSLVENDFQTTADLLGRDMSVVRNGARTVDPEVDRYYQLAQSLPEIKGLDAQISALREMQDLVIQTSGGIESMNAGQTQLLARLQASEKALLGFRNAQGGAEELARQEIATLAQQAGLRETILRLGEDSAQVAARRLEAERETYQAWVDTLDIAQPLKDEMMAAWDAAEGIASARIAAAIEAALGPASRLGDLLRSAAGWWQQVKSEAEAENIIRRFNQDSASDAKVYSGRGQDPRVFLDPPSPPTANSFGGVGTAGSSAGGAGGGVGTGGLAALQSEARDVLAELDRDIAVIEEKLRAGLVDQTEATEAVRRAKDQAAGRIAELIPQLAALGEGGAAAVATWRGALDGLAGDLKGTGEDLSQTLSEGFKSPFAEFLKGAASGQEAMDAFADHVLSRLADIAAEQLQMGLLEPLLGSLFSGFKLGGAAGAAAGNGGQVIHPFATGGAPEGADLRDWRNQVVTAPTLFGMRGGIGLMAEAGDEAILPVGDGGVMALGEGGEQRLPLVRGPAGRLGVMLPPSPAGAEDGGGMPALPRLPGFPSPGPDPAPLSLSVLRRDETTGFPAVGGAQGEAPRQDAPRLVMLPGFGTSEPPGRDGGRLQPAQGSVVATPPSTPPQEPGEAPRRADPLGIVLPGFTASASPRAGTGGTGPLPQTPLTGPLLAPDAGPLPYRDGPSVPNLHRAARPDWRPAVLDRAPVSLGGGAPSGSGRQAAGEASDAGAVQRAAPPAPQVNLAMSVNVEGVPEGHTARVEKTGSDSDMTVNVILEKIGAGLASEVAGGRGPLSQAIAHSFGLTRKPR